MGASKADLGLNPVNRRTKVALRPVNQSRALEDLHILMHPAVLAFEGQGQRIHRSDGMRMHIAQKPDTFAGKHL